MIVRQLEIAAFDRPESPARAQPPSRRPQSHHAPGRMAASDPGVSIADFRSTPATITMHVGDTVTWTNDGPSAYTASARDGSFETGVLQSGQSAAPMSREFGRWRRSPAEARLTYGNAAIAGGYPSATDPHLWHLDDNWI
jgi:plastocyanin